MNDFPPNLQRLIDDLSRQKDLAPNVADGLRQAIDTSPYLTAMMAEAMEAGLLRRLRISPRGTHASGHFDAQTNTVYVNVEVFQQHADDQQALFDAIVSTLAHETSHAFGANAFKNATYALAFDVEKAIREAGPGGQADLTPAFDQYLDKARENEAWAELSGWNALASRIRHTNSGVLPEGTLLRRAVGITDCVISGPQDNQLAPGLSLTADGQIPHAQIEQVARCHFDAQRPAGHGLGAQGRSDYTNYYGTLGFEAAAAVIRRWADPPELRIDMAMLGLRAEMLESNGLNLGGQGHMLSFTDTSDGQAQWTGLHHTRDADHEMSPDSIPRREDATAAMGPGHRHYALYQQIRGHVHALDAAHGRAPDETSENITVSLLALAREHGLQRADPVVLSVKNERLAAGENIFVVQGVLDDPTNLRPYLRTIDASQTPVADSLQRLDATDRAQMLTQTQALHANEQALALQTQARGPVLAR